MYEKISSMVTRIAPLGFEPRSRGPEPRMMDRYTKGLYANQLPLDSNK